jgi:2-aminobenzoate-CoA ligase
MIPSAHKDTFTRDNLPPQSQWPKFSFDLDGLDYPERMNCVTELLDNWIARGHGNHPCIISPSESWSYAQFAERVNRIANVLTRDLGLVPGNRVLLRAPNNPMMAAAYFAVMKAGGVVIGTMPLLRAKELSYVVTKAKVAIALCDVKLSDEMEKTKAVTTGLDHIVYWGGGKEDSLEKLMAQKGYETFAACDTANDDVCLIGFTSGTTGEPKGTMHFHRDILATCDSYGRHVLRANDSDRFIGSPPLAFTFGLGGLVLFPLRAGAATILLHRRTSRDDLLHCAYRLSRDARQGRGLRHFFAAQMHLRGRGASESDVRRVAGSDRNQDHGWHRRDRDAAHLHRLAGRRNPPRLHRPRRAGL